MSDWLKNITIGDEIIVSKSGHRSITTVEFVTNTTVATKDSNARYRKSTGKETGNNKLFDWLLIEPTVTALAETRAEMNKRQADNENKWLQSQKQP